MCSLACQRDTLRSATVKSQDGARPMVNLPPSCRGRHSGRGGDRDCGGSQRLRRGRPVGRVPVGSGDGGRARKADPLAGAAQPGERLPGHSARSEDPAGPAGTGDLGRQIDEKIGQLGLVFGPQRRVHPVQERLLAQTSLSEPVPELADRLVALGV